MTIKQATLWSFLTQSNAKREIICPDGLRVSIEELFEELKFQLQDNQLPASAELTMVNWDDTGTTQKLILVRYTANQSSTNVLQFAVGLEQLGKFAYLEKRIFLDPPVLPPLIKGKQNIDYEELENEGTDPVDTIFGCGSSLVLGVIGAVAGLITLILFGTDLSGVGMFFAIIAFVMFGIIFKGFFSDMEKKQAVKQAVTDRNQERRQRNEEIRKQNAEIDQWNRQKQKRDQERQKAFDRWHSEVLEVAYLSRTSDIFGRWTSAVSTTIDQVVQKLFIDRRAQAQQWQEERTSQEQIENELKRRNAEMFG